MHVLCNKSQVFARKVCEIGTPEKSPKTDFLNNFFLDIVATKGEIIKSIE